MNTKTVFAVAMLIACVLALSGCATTQNPVEPDVVTRYVTVQKECPAPAMPRRPILPADTLRADATDDEVARAVVGSLEVMKDYAEALEGVIRAYQ